MGKFGDYNAATTVAGTEEIVIKQTTTKRLTLSVLISKLGLLLQSIGGDARGTNAIDFQFTRASADQVAATPNSFIAGGANNKIINWVNRGTVNINGHAEGNGNSIYDFNSHAEGSGCIVDGKISHAEGNNTICSGNDSHTEGAMSGCGRRRYLAVTGGSEDAGDGLGVLSYALIPATYGDQSKYFPNPLQPDPAVTYGAGWSADVKGNVYPNGFTPALWTGDVPTTLNHLTWAMHTICIIKGAGEGDDKFVDIRKCTYAPETGTKVYYSGNTLSTTISEIWSSYCPTLLGMAQHAEGNYTNACGYGSHSEGHMSTAWGNYSHAEAHKTTATGDGSHSEGGYSVASGIYSHAGGYGTLASGAYAKATGLESIASRSHQVAHSAGKRSVSGDNQISLISYTQSCSGAGEHQIHVMDAIGDNKTYHFETFLIARQTAGTAGTVGDSFAYKITGLIKRANTTYTVIGTPTVTLIGKDAGMDAAIEITWSTTYLTDAGKSISLRFNSIADTVFQVTTNSIIQELG